jgi:hypothetical protein
MSLCIPDCEALIDDALPRSCREDGPETRVDIHPDRIVEDANLNVALYAQSTTGRAIIINLMMPRLRRFLKRLAGDGVGCSDEFGGVKYRFMKITSSAPSTPSSSL